MPPRSPSRLKRAESRIADLEELVSEMGTQIDGYDITSVVVAVERHEQEISDAWNRIRALESKIERRGRRPRNGAR